jgi:hypothetical protein
MQRVSLAPNFRVAGTRLRLYSTFNSNASSNPPRLIINEHSLLEERKERDAFLRKRKTEWKRRQGVRCDITTRVHHSHLTLREKHFSII